MVLNMSVSLQTTIEPVSGVCSRVADEGRSLSLMEGHDNWSNALSKMKQPVDVTLSTIKFS